MSKDFCKVEHEGFHTVIFIHNPSFLESHVLKQKKHSKKEKK